MILSKKKRQEYLKYLGFYDGAIDGIVGAKTKQAYRDLQKTYFTRKQDKDGQYGKDTDKLLVNAYNVAIYAPSCKLEDFRCKCSGYCTGYPTYISVYLLNNVQAIKEKFGKTNISSGLRCKKYNAELKGSSKNSRHLLGRAIDFNIPKMNKEEVIKFCKTLPYQRYTYTNNTNMRGAVHTDTKK